MPQSIIPLLALCWAAGCNVLGSADVDHLDMLQRGAASLESVERDEAAAELEGSSSNDGAGAPAPAPACKRRCQRKYDKFVKKGKEKKGFEKTCKKAICAGCDFCTDEPETPAAPAPAPEEAGEDEDVGPAPAPAPAPEDADVDEEDEEEADVDDVDDVAESSPAPAPAPAPEEAPAPAPAPAPEEAGEDEEVGPAPAPAPAPEDADVDEEDEEEADVDDDDDVAESSPAPAPKPSASFTKVAENRFWGCPRKGMNNLHGFGHRTVQECFAATLKDPACKGLFDYNQRHNGQCKCVVHGGCRALRPLGGYIAYKVDDA